MSAVSDDAVLAILKKDPELRDLIASACTLQDAERLSLPRFGGPGRFREKAGLIRGHLEQEAAPDAQAEIVREAGQ